MVNPDDLTDEQLNQILNNPEVVKTLDYESMGVFELSDMLSNLQDADNFSVYTEAIAERSGRITQQTVEKVIRGMINESDEYDNREAEDSDE